MTERMMDGTGAGLVDFLTWAADRGKMNASTAGAHKAAVTQVLELEADDFGTIDIKNLDVNDILDRFVRKKGHKYNPDSLATYQGRFRRLRIPSRSDPESPPTSSSRGSFRRARSIEWSAFCRASRSIRSRR